MANPICLSPLKFYDSLDKQEFRKTYAYGHVSPLITRANTISPFQFVIPNTYPLRQLNTAYIYDVKGNRVTGNIATTLENAGFSIQTINGYNVAMFPYSFPIPELKYEGFYYLELTSSDGIWKFYSEVFCYTNELDDCLEIEYWNETGDFAIKNGIITFQNGFRFKLYLKSELGKPEYSFEEEATKRLGYSFIESQVSKKIYKFNTVIPEYLCDAMRLIRLCSNKKLICKGEEYDMLTFDMEVDWQTQGDLASVTCEFETDNVLVNLGGFIPEKLGGDFAQKEYNIDFNITAPKERDVILCSFDAEGRPSNSMFTVRNGNGKSGSNIEVDGVVYTTALKIESNTKISFAKGTTENQNSTLIMYCGTGETASIKVNGTNYSSSNNVLEIPLTRGIVDYELTKRNVCNVYLIKIVTTLVT